MPASKHLTRPQVAAMFGVTTKTVTKWQRQKTDPLPVVEINTGATGNKYDPRAVFEWGLRRRLGTLEANPDDGQDQLDFNSERARLTRAQAEKAELELAEKRGKLLDASLVERALVGLLSNFRARILALPSKAAPKCVAATDAKEARAILKAHCYEALDELANGEIGESVRSDLRNDLEGGSDGKAAA